MARSNLNIRMAEILKDREVDSIDDGLIKKYYAPKVAGSFSIKSHAMACEYSKTREIVMCKAGKLQNFSTMSDEKKKLMIEMYKGGGRMNLHAQKRIIISTLREIDSGSKVRKMNQSQKNKIYEEWESIIRLNTLNEPKAIKKRRVIFVSRRKRILSSKNFIAGCRPVIKALINCGIILGDSIKDARFDYRQHKEAESNNYFTEIIILFV